MLEHPEIGWMTRTGYPSCMQERGEPVEEDDELEDFLDEEEDFERQFWGDDYADRLYDEQRDRELFGD
jgi:hypothetical protein